MAVRHPRSGQQMPREEVPLVGDHRLEPVARVGSEVADGVALVFGVVETPDSCLDRLAGTAAAFGRLGECREALLASPAEAVGRDPARFVESPDCHTGHPTVVANRFCHIHRGGLTHPGSAPSRVVNAYAGGVATR